MISHSAPYYDLETDYQVILALARHELPRRPPYMPPYTPNISDDVWGFILQCLNLDATNRPSASDLVPQLHTLIRSHRRDLEMTVWTAPPMVAGTPAPTESSEVQDPLDLRSSFAHMETLQLSGLLTVASGTGGFATVFQAQWNNRKVGQL